MFITPFYTAILGLIFVVLSFRTLLITPQAPSRRVRPTIDSLNVTRIALKRPSCRTGARVARVS
jgi:hypothetical protein